MPSVSTATCYRQTHNDVTTSTQQSAPWPSQCGCGLLRRFIRQIRFAFSCLHFAPVRLPPHIAPSARSVVMYLCPCQLCALTTRYAHAAVLLPTCAHRLAYRCPTPRCWWPVWCRGGQFGDGVGPVRRRRASAGAPRCRPALSIISSGTTFGLIIAGGWLCGRQTDPDRRAVDLLAFAALAATVALIAYRAIRTPTPPPHHLGSSRTVSVRRPMRCRCASKRAVRSGGSRLLHLCVDMSARFEPALGALPCCSSRPQWRRDGRRGGALRSRQLTAAAIAVHAASIAGWRFPRRTRHAALAAVHSRAYMPFAALLAIWNQRLHPRMPQAASSSACSASCRAVVPVVMSSRRTRCASPSITARSC